MLVVGSQWWLSAFSGVGMLVETQRLGATRNGNSFKTHCKRGHPFDEANTYISPKSKKRSCRICDALVDKARFDMDPDSARRKQREHMRIWRAVNRERDRRNWTTLRQRKKEWLDSQKTACARCGESDIVCLDFHHRDASMKDANLSIAVAHWSIRKLRIEMAKCEILCSNCHRKLHAAERQAQEKVA